MTDNKRFRVLRDATILAVVLLVVTVVWVMAADPPNTISYQGYLTDASGTAITDTPDMQVVLYTVDTGGTGVYTETHSTVTVSDGQFNLLLGTGTDTSGTWSNDVDFSQALWLEITIDPSGTPETLSPRIPLSTVPHARYAQTVPDNYIATQQISDTLTFADGDLVDLSGIIANTTTEGLKLPAYDVGATADGQITWDSASDKLYVGDNSAAQEIGALGSSIDTSEITENTIINADISSTANIDPDKLAFMNSGILSRHLAISGQSTSFNW